MMAFAQQHHSLRCGGRLCASPMIVSASRLGGRRSARERPDISLRAEASPSNNGESSSATTSATKPPPSQQQQQQQQSQADRRQTQQESKDEFSWQEFLTSDLPGKLGIMIGLIALSRVGVYIRLPGVDVDAFAATMANSGVMGYAQRLDRHAHACNDLTTTAM